MADTIIARRQPRRVPVGDSGPPDAPPGALGAGAALPRPPPPPLPPPPQLRQTVATRAQAAWECGFYKKLALFGCLMHGATQIASLLAWSSLPFSERFQRLLSIAHRAAAVMVPALAPVFYMRWRPQFVMVYRVTFFAFPLLRRPRGGWECQLPCFAAACGPATLSFSWRCDRWVSVTPAATPHSIPACTSCLA